MRILLINTVASQGSTGRATKEIKQKLNQHGDVCRIAYAMGNTTDDDFRFSNCFEHYVHLGIERIFGLEGYASWLSTWRLLRYIDTFRPDIIHLFVLHSHVINLNMLFSYTAKKKIPLILNLDDFWWMSGKCTHFFPYDCSKYKDTCFHCPAKKQPPKSWFFDFSKKMQHDKDIYYKKQMSLQTICVSNYVRDVANSSFLLKEYKNNVVYNWIDTSKFKMPDVDMDNTIKGSYILFVSTKWIYGSEKYIGLKHIIEKVPNGVRIMVVGEINRPILKLNVQYRGTICEETELAKIYSNASVYVHLSRYETFGKVIAEAMACGTPSVVFNSTALAEIVDNTVGYVCNSTSVDGLLEGIKTCINNGKDYYSHNCIVKSHALYDADKNIQAIRDIYSKCIKKTGEGG